MDGDTEENIDDEVTAAAIDNAIRNSILEWLKVSLFLLLLLREVISVRCQDSSMVGFLRTDSMVSGLSPTSAKLSHRVRRVASSL